MIQTRCKSGPSDLATSVDDTDSERHVPQAHQMLWKLFEGRIRKVREWN